MDERQLVQAFCEAVNQVKRTAFTPDMVDLDWHLGGDFGLESVEMLEVWLELEQRLRIRILDESKRNIYTLQEMLEVLGALQDARVAG